MEVLIVASTEGIIIRGLEMKLKRFVEAPEYSSPLLSELQEKCAGKDLIIFFTDEKLSGQDATLNFLGDYCGKKDARIIVVGAKDEYEYITEHIPLEYILPLVPRPLDVDALLTEAEKYMVKGLGQKGRKSILIVDDDVSYLSMISNWLSEWYHVSTVESGVKAINWLADHETDLILLDYEMPVVSGPQVLEMLRGEELTAHIPVIFLTGIDDKESIIKAVGLRPQGYVLKTIEKQGLREHIARFFQTAAIS